MFLASARFLENNRQAVNALNVFPVPDGDTGTNMALTMMAAVKEVQSFKGEQVDKIADAAAKGALKGARGNSGVILSQLLRGFAKGLQGIIDKIDTKDYAKALQEGVKTAYKAVMKPVEGTMLTVARVTAEEAMKISKRVSDFELFYKEIIKVAKQTLDKTPEMLFALKEAGVVDSGGMGILYLMMGAGRALSDEIDIDDIEAFSSAEETSVSSKPDVESLEDIKFGYCTEFFIKNLFPYVEEGDIDKLKDKLEKLGDSLVVVGDEDLIKVHIHTNMPGKVLQLALRFGELSGIKIDNMREQHRSLVVTDEKVDEKEYGFITVAMGEGISSIFKDLSADYVIEGGQTMNPSIDDLLKGIEKVNAKTIFILPNNSNIILSAKQAQEISEKNVVVIPSKSIPQGLAALIAFNGEADLDTNIEAMNEAMASVKTGQITYAVRDSSFNGVSIQKEDIIGIVDGEILRAGKEIEQVTKELLSDMLDEDSEIVTLLYGADISEDEAQKIGEFLEENYPNLDVEIHFGGQPLYYYIISVE